jgi:hypothetical protein
MLTMSKTAATPQTRLVRVPADLAEMLSAIVWHDRNVVIPELIEPLIRPTVKRMYDRLPKDARERAAARISAKS